MNSNSNRCSAIGNETVDDYFKKVMNLLKMSHKYSQELQGWHHYNDYKGVKLTMNKIQFKIQSLITQIFNHQGLNLNINRYNLASKFELVREANDAMLERINIDIDEASGIRRTADVEIVDNTVRTIRGPVNQTTGREMVILASRNVQKPQLFFPTKIDNSPKEPFLPKLKEKPNSIKPLSVMLCIDDSGKEYYSHPYEYELMHWSPDDDVLKFKEPMKPRPLNETPFKMINNLEDLESLVQSLKIANEIAIDLEAHDFRSYLGLTCLIQISTRNEDFIIDPFSLMDQLEVLNEVFTDPKITKVFHGGDRDVLWLQRDFGLYVVNMFDSHQAASILDYPHRSLAALLQGFCSVTADKTYQRADWRIRPLPEDFLHYARQDTHYLLYIYDMLRNELIEKGNAENNLINATYSRSTEICMKRFEKPFVDKESYLKFYLKTRKILNNRQLYALQQIFLWRDKVARDQDESVHYVLPNHMMLQMSEVLPKEMQGILACCNPIPSLVRTEQLTLHQIIRAARELPLEDIIHHPTSSNQTTSNDLEMNHHHGGRSNMNCRHDLSHVEDSASGLSTLLNPQETLLGDLFQQEEKAEDKLKSMSTLFGLNSKSIMCNRTGSSTISEEFASPYERYLLYLDLQPSLEEERKPIEKLDLPLSFPSAESDSDRIIRLQQHTSSLSVDANQSTKAESVSSKCSKKESKKSTEDQRVMNIKSKTKKGKKRNSSELKVDQSNSKRRMTSQASSDVEEETTDQVPETPEPFDYSKADYSIFGKNKVQHSHDKKLKEKFKSKGSKKSSGLTKGNLKSISWGKR